MLAPYPRPRDFPADAAAEREAAWMQAVVLGVRQIRGEMNISPAQAHRRCCCKDASAEDEALRRSATGRCSSASPAWRA